MRFEEEGETLKDKSRCANIRADLKICLLESDCCKIVSERKTSITYNTPDAATIQRYIFLYICILSFAKNNILSCYSLHFCLNFLYFSSNHVYQYRFNHIKSTNSDCQINSGILYLKLCLFVLSISWL